MSDEFDWNFVDKDDAKAEIRAAVEYLLKGATGGARGDIVQSRAGCQPARRILSMMTCPAASWWLQIQAAMAANGGWPLHESRKAAGESGFSGLSCALTIPASA